MLTAEIPEGRDYIQLVQRRQRLESLGMRDIQQGRDAEVIGVTMPDGTIDAVRVIVSVNGRPAGMPPDATIRDLRGRPFPK